MTTTAITPGTISLALVGTSESLVGDERLLAAVHADDHVLVLVEARRSSNQSLLTARQLWIHDDNGAQMRPVIGRRPLSDEERQQFEAATPADLGENLEVIRLGRGEPNPGPTHD